MNSKLLQEASEIIFGDRQDDYGHPAISFARIRDFWNTALRHKFKEGEDLSLDDVIILFSLAKHSRWLHSYKRDHPRDIAGYAGLAERVREMEPPFEGDPDQEDFSALKEDQTSQRQADQSHARSVIEARTPEDSLSLEKLHGRQLEGNRPTDMEGLPTEELNKILKSSDTSEEDFCEAKAGLEKRESPVGVKNATTQIQPIPNWKAIVCTDSDGNIGRDGKLPWPTSEGDLKHFKDMTMGHIVVFGRKTWESIPVRLKGREVIVVSNTLDGWERKFHIVRDPNKALQSEVNYIQSVSTPEKTVWICGGASIYKQLLPYCSEVHWTWLHKFYGGNTRFEPDLDLWKKNHHETRVEGDRTFYVYKRA